MNRLYSRYLKCLKVLILLGFSAQFAVSFADSNAHADAAPVMVSIPTQFVAAEQPFTYRIQLENPKAGQSVGMRLINAPKGATLTDNGDSSYEFRWIPPAKVGEQTVIIVQAFDVAAPKAAPNVFSTQRIVLQRGSAEQVKAAASNETTIGDADVAGTVAASNNATNPQSVRPLKNATTSSSTTVAMTETTKAAITAEAAVTAKKAVESDAAATATLKANKAAVNTATSRSSKVEADTGSTASTAYQSKFRTKPSVRAEPGTNPGSMPRNLLAESGDATAESKTTASLTMPESGSVLEPRNTTDPDPVQVPRAPATKSIASYRPELPQLGIQRLTVGEEFQFFIRPIEVGDTQVKLSTREMPTGATFEDIFEGSKMLRWTPTADQVGRHKMLLVLLAEDASDVSLLTEREVFFVVEPAPPIELEPELAFEPISAQIVSAGRKVNIRVEPKASDDKIALLQVDRLPAGGSFDENKDGTRTFHWPTTQADQGEHTFRFTAIHPDNAELVANVEVLIVVGSPDGFASGPSAVNAVASENASPSPELDVYPSADSPPPAPNLSAASPPPDSPVSVDSPSPEPYPSADTASPEPLAIRPTPQPRPTPD